MTAMKLSAATAAVPLQAQPLKFAARHTLFEEGDPADYLYEVVSGVVMTYKLLPDGRRQIFEIMRPGQFIGFTQVPAHVHGAQTLSKCRLRRYLQRSFLASPSNQAKLLQHLVSLQDAHYAHALVLSRKSAAQRIAIFFAEFVGTNFEGEELDVSLREISDYLGLRHETVSRQLGRLCALSLISRSRWGSYRVCDRQGLLAFGNELGANDGCDKPIAAA